MRCGLRSPSLRPESLELSSRSQLQSQNRNLTEQKRSSQFKKRVLRNCALACVHCFVQDSDSDPDHHRHLGHVELNQQHSLRELRLNWLGTTRDPPPTPHTASRLTTLDCEARELQLVIAIFCFGNTTHMSAFVLLNTKSDCEQRGDGWARLLCTFTPCVRVCVVAVAQERELERANLGA